MNARRDTMKGNTIVTQPAGECWAWEVEDRFSLAFDQRSEGNCVILILPKTLYMGIEHVPEHLESCLFLKR